MANALYTAMQRRKNRAFGPTVGPPKRLRVPGESTGVKGVYRRPALKYNSDRPAYNGLKPRVIPSPLRRQKVTRV